MSAVNVHTVGLTTVVLAAATVVYLALRLALGSVAALLKWLRQAYVLRHTPMAPGASVWPLHIPSPRAIGSLFFSLQHAQSLAAHHDRPDFAHTPQLSALLCISVSPQPRSPSGLRFPKAFSSSTISSHPCMHSRNRLPASHRAHRRALQRRG